MRNQELQFVRQLEALGKEQARIESSSPIPSILRPFASFLGKRTWQTLLLTSIILGGAISVWMYSFVLVLFERGVLAWLLR